MKELSVLKLLEQFPRDNSSSVYKPQIYSMNREANRKALHSLFRSKKITRVVDVFDDQKEELMTIMNPKMLFGKMNEKEIHRDLPQAGVWVYYPWHFTLVHVLEQKLYSKVRTSRNQNLILPREQKKFEQWKIGIAGLNVGNPAAICIALEGGGTYMKFADNDVLSLSNLNRFRASLADLGLNKTILSARQVFEVNPFVKIRLFPSGIQKGKEEKFLLHPKIDILIEEMDSLPLKISIREKARKYRIPVLMVTGNGESVIIDIERFDLNPRLPLLNGYLKSRVIDKVHTIEEHGGTFEERVLLARDFMGVRELSKRLADSFLHVGSNLAGIPQLAEASFLRGAVLCYFTRQIAMGARIPSGRYYLRSDQITKSRKA